MRTWEEMEEYDELPARLVTVGKPNERLFFPPQSWTIFSDIIVCCPAALHGLELRVVTYADEICPADGYSNWRQPVETKTKTRHHSGAPEDLQLLEAAGIELTWTTHYYRFNFEPTQIYPLEHFYVEYKLDSIGIVEAAGEVDGKVVDPDKMPTPQVIVQLMPVGVKELEQFVHREMNHKAPWVMPKDVGEYNE